METAVIVAVVKPRQAGKARRQQGPLPAFPGQDLGEPVKALASYRKALALADALSARNPKDLKALRALALRHMQLGGLLPFEDPAACQGTEEECLDKFSQVRDQIEARIKAWLAAHP